MVPPCCLKPEQCKNKKLSPCQTSPTGLAYTREQRPAPRRTLPASSVRRQLPAFPCVTVPRVTAAASPRRRVTASQTPGNSRPRRVRVAGLRAADCGYPGPSPRCPRGRPDYECRQRCSEVTASVASCRAPGAEGSCDIYNIFTTVCLVFTIFTIFTISDCHNVAALDDDRPGLHQDTVHGRHPG